MRTKGEIVANALSLLAINVSTEPPTHDDMALGVNVLESMMRDWLQKNIDLGYSCLLYTSPSPRDRTRSRMPSSA